MPECPQHYPPLCADDLPFPAVTPLLHSAANCRGNDAENQQLLKSGTDRAVDKQWIQLLAGGTDVALRGNETCSMTLRIETCTNGESTVLRLIGRIRSEHLEELIAQIDRMGPRIVFDMAGVTLVDVDVVRFLGSCEAEGIEVVHCPPYIREWIVRERDNRSEMPQHF